MSPKAPARHLHPADLRALAQLTTQAALGVTHIVEGVHQSVWSTLGAAGGKSPGQTSGITGLVYKSIRTVTQLIGSGADTLLKCLQPVLAAGDDDIAATPQRDAVLAALNGVMGDRLLASGNPLAIPMSLRCNGQTLDGLTSPHGTTAKVLLLIHGLCMSDLHWQIKDSQGAAVSGGDHASALVSALAYTPVYLRYNSGLHVSQNGRELARLLQQLVDRWPQAVEELSVLAHSMGGLLIRSAFHYARQQGLGWPDRVGSIVFLGTPHHGAPLERAGNRVDAFLGSTPYTAPFARLGQVRSAGITDLRHGNVLDEDWLGQDRFLHRGDHREPLPLPEGVACFAVAASTAARHSPLADRLIGDGLVPVPSALGQHADARRCLSFPRDSRLIVYRTRHIGLISNAVVTRQLLRWLQTPGRD